MIEPTACGRNILIYGHPDDPSDICQPYAIEFYFGTEMPEDARDGAILDPGTGYDTNRAGGLGYGWDCDGKIR